MQAPVPPRYILSIIGANADTATSLWNSSADALVRTVWFLFVLVLVIDLRVRVLIAPITGASICTLMVVR